MDCQFDLVQMGAGLPYNFEWSQNFFDSFLDGLVVWMNFTSTNTRSPTWIFGARECLASVGSLS